MYSFLPALIITYHSLFHFNCPRRYVLRFCDAPLPGGLCCTFDLHLNFAFEIWIANYLPKFLLMNIDYFNPAT
jgi:hypothetical protein